MKHFLSFVFLLFTHFAIGQVWLSPLQRFDSLNLNPVLPDNLFTTRSVVLYDHGFSQKDLEEAQKGFQRAGIDAVVYFDMNLIISGKDLEYGLASNIFQRSIENLIFYYRENGLNTLVITPFNKKVNFLDARQQAWKAENTSRRDLFQALFLASTGKEKTNMLINDFPERDLPLAVIRGQRSPFFATDLRVDLLAVPKTGNPEYDRILEQMFSAWPYKYKLTEADITEKQLQTNGFMYKLCYAYAPNQLALSLLGYRIGDTESAVASIVFSESGKPEVKNIGRDEKVFKFYFKHLPSSNVFLGVQWDADVTLEKALKNHIEGMKNTWGIK